MSSNDLGVCNIGTVDNIKMFLPDLVLLVVFMASPEGSYRKLMRVNRRWRNLVREVCKWQEPPKLKLSCFMDSVHSLKWAHYNGCTWIHLIFSELVVKDKEEMCSWVAMNTLLPWDACYRVAELGNLKMLKFLREKIPNIFWNTSVCNVAAQNGHFDVLVWAVENGCPCHLLRCMHLAKTNKHYDISKWCWEFWTNHHKKCVEGGSCLDTSTDLLPCRTFFSGGDIDPKYNDGEEQ